MVAIFEFLSAVGVSIVVISLSCLACLVWISCVEDFEASWILKLLIETRRKGMDEGSEMVFVRRLVRRETREEI